MKNKIVHFEIQAEQPERAMIFYKDVFGWNFQRWGEQDYWIVMTPGRDVWGPRVNGGLFPRVPRKSGTPPEESAANAFVCTVLVEDFDEIERRITKAGGFVTVPKIGFLSMAWQGYFIDTEGNTFGLYQPDKNAR